MLSNSVQTITYNENRMQTGQKNIFNWISASNNKQFDFCMCYALSLSLSLTLSVFLRVFCYHCLSDYWLSGLLVLVWLKHSWTVKTTTEAVLLIIQNQATNIYLLYYLYVCELLFMLRQNETSTYIWMNEWHISEFCSMIPTNTMDVYCAFAWLRLMSTQNFNFNTMKKQTNKLDTSK